MGLFDGYSDPPPWPESGGLLARLMALQQEQDQYQRGGRFDIHSSVGGAQPLSSSSAGASSLLSPLLPSTSWPMPSAGAVNDGHMSVGSPVSPPDMNSQYQALRPLLGDHPAMIATVHPQVGQSLITQALANRQESNNAGSSIPVWNNQPEGAASPSAQNPQAGPVRYSSTLKYGVNSVGDALKDFYRQTIQQGGNDIAGYAKDAVSNPSGFVHAVGPSMGAFSPILSDVPALARGVLGLLGSLRFLDVPPLPDELIGNNARKGGDRSNTDLRGLDANPEEVFRRLVGRRFKTLGDGTRQGLNGIRFRVSTGDGPRIDIPANGAKEHETIHFPETDQ